MTPWGARGEKSRVSARAAVAFFANDDAQGVPRLNLRPRPAPIHAAHPLLSILGIARAAAAHAAKDAFFGQQAVLRVSLASAAFFGGLAAALAGASPADRDALQHGAWGAKLAAWARSFGGGRADMDSLIAKGSSYSPKRADTQRASSARAASLATTGKATYGSA